MESIKKLIVGILMFSLLLGRSYSFVLADDPGPTPDPTANTTNTTDANTTNTTTDTNTTTTPTPTPVPVVTPVAPISPISPIAPIAPVAPKTADTNKTANTTTNAIADAPLAPTGDIVSTGQTDGGNVGDTAIVSGDANNSANIINTGNDNLASGCSACVGGDSTSVSNTGNGSDSTNSGSASIGTDSNTTQNNSAGVLNNASLGSISGTNQSSGNVGSTSITSGDSNTSGTLLNALNTNVDGVAVSEFNITGDQKGDFVLNFGSGCISGCTNLGGVNVANTGNGTDSTSTGAVDTNTTNNTTQNNDGNLTNNANFLADSGTNMANSNTGGDTSITTGDANVDANLLNFLNNNILGDVVFGVVNIYGNLVGDIILPDNVFDQLTCTTCGGSTSVANTGNGSDSTNTGSVNNTSTDNTFQSNNADIANNVTLNGSTGNNFANGNTGGNIDITTGAVDLSASILNLANLNLIGSNMWLVFINNAGQWIGQLFGADSSGNMAGSPGVQFAINPDGSISVINANNGAGSDNTGTVNNTNTSNTNQTNNAQITNNVNITANTGSNHADGNTGGNVSITTGDVQAIANIVNFVNNNIKGGKLLVTFVNVFGTWMGDFITPGHPKVTASSNNNSGGNGGSSNNNTSAASSTSSTNHTTKGVIAAAGFFSGGSANTGNGGSSSIKIAGISNSSLGNLANAASTNKKTEINLAWIVLLVSFSLLTIRLRKRYFSRTS